MSVTTSPRANGWRLILQASKESRSCRLWLYLCVIIPPYWSPPWPIPLGRTITPGPIVYWRPRTAWLCNTCFLHAGGCHRVADYRLSADAPALSAYLNMASIQICSIKYWSFQHTHEPGTTRLRLTLLHAPQPDECPCRYRCHQYCSAARIFTGDRCGPWGTMYWDNICYVHLSCLACLSVSGYTADVVGGLMDLKTCAAQWPPLR